MVGSFASNNVVGGGSARPHSSFCMEGIWRLGSHSIHAGKSGMYVGDAGCPCQHLRRARHKHAENQCMSHIHTHMVSILCGALGVWCDECGCDLMHVSSTHSHCRRDVWPCLHHRLSTRLHHGKLLPAGLEPATYGSYDHRSNH